MSSVDVVAGALAFVLSLPGSVLLDDVSVVAGLGDSAVGSSLLGVSEAGDVDDSGDATVDAV